MGATGRTLGQMSVPRLRVNRVTIDREDGRVRVDVELGHDDRTTRGQAETSEGVRGTIQAAAAAAVSAINQFLPSPWLLRFEEAVLQSVAQRDAVIVQLRLRSEEVEERLVGSAVSDRIPEEAAVRAVLNAAERRTTPLLH